MITTAYFPDPLKTAEAAGAKLTSEIKDERVLLLLSGGSAVEILKFVNPKIMQPGSVVGLLDERITPFKEDRNVQKIQDVWPDISIFAPDQQGSLTDIAHDYGEKLGKYKNYKTVITQGIGPDGHTAGILPYPEDETHFDELFHGSEEVIGYDAMGKSPYPSRITVTFKFLSNVNTSIVYACGGNKKVALLKIKQKMGRLAMTPALVLNDMQNVFLFTDQQTPRKL